MSLMAQIKDIAAQCRNNAEYFQGHETGYAFDSIAHQLEKLVEKPYGQHILDIAAQIKRLPAGAYKTARGDNCFMRLTGSNYSQLMQALSLLKKEGVVWKIKNDGTKSEHGQLWMLDV